MCWFKIIKRSSYNKLVNDISSLKSTVSTLEKRNLSLAFKVKKLENEKKEYEKIFKNMASKSDAE